MKKEANFLVVLGSGLAAFGFSGWQATGVPGGFVQPGTGDIQGAYWVQWTYSAGWTLNNQLEITLGVVLLICGLMLRKDSK
jgi:hypothetical protein